MGEPSFSSEIDFEGQQTENTSRERRSRTQPKRFEDFVADMSQSIDPTKPMHNQSSYTVHSVANHIIPMKFFLINTTFLAAISTSDKPKWQSEHLRICTYKLNSGFRLRPNRM